MSNTINDKTEKQRSHDLSGFVDVVLNLCQEDSRASAEIECGGCLFKVSNIAFVDYFEYLDTGILFFEFFPAPGKCLMVQAFNDGNLIGTHVAKLELEVPVSRVCTFECGVTKLCNKYGFRKC